jgi:lipopolysaccharide transport system ATP-binding protein
MAKTVLKVDNISKLYRLGEVGTGTISHDLNRWWAKVRGQEDPFAKIGQTNDRTKKSESDYVWALKDINFEVKEGDVLGIIGKNGAGKSTLLKIISQITSPTLGAIKVKGRIAALLEVGTGMNPELTARENIYLNGAILGMRKFEIDRKFDEIVDFSGCALYVDTPLKRFSSGMRVRLGFAVAAFLEPEILIVDEVLAVGDAEFQKKAIGKMKDVSKGEGRTVLFVSHNMAAVKSLCTRSVLLENGTLTYDDSTDLVISKYLGASNDILNYRKNVNKIEGFEIISFGVRSINKDFADPIIRTDEIVIEMECENNTTFDEIHLTLKLKGEDGNYFLTTTSVDQVDFVKGKQKIKMIIPNGFFNDGGYFVDILIVANRKSVFFMENDAISFLVNPEPKAIGEFMGRELGYVRSNFKWEKE